MVAVFPLEAFALHVKRCQYPIVVRLGYRWDVGLVGYVMWDLWEMGCGTGGRWEFGHQNMLQMGG